MLDRKLSLSLLLLPACFSDPDPPSSSSTSNEGGTLSTTAASSSTTGTTAETLGAGTAGTSGGDTASSDGSAGGATSGEDASESSTSGGVAEDSTTGSTGVGEGGSSSSSTGEVVLDCVQEVLGTAVGMSVATADTSTAKGAFETSCGGYEAQDLAFSWTAPTTNYYVFDTHGSSIDTVLALFEGQCEAPPELACNDNAAQTVASEVVAPVQAGETYVLVVEGNAGEAGPIALNIHPVECPAGTLRDRDFPARFSNAGGDNALSSGCGGAEGPERTFRYTATTAGVHRFRVSSSEFSPILVLQEGPICGGPTLQCHAGREDLPAEVVRVLEVGETVTLIVDSGGGTGNFTIDLERTERACPEVEFENGRFEGSIGNFEHTMSMSCAAVGETVSGTLRAHPSVTFAWTSPGPQGSNSGCTILLDAQFPAALSLQEGVCNGPEVECAEAELSAAATMYTASIEIGHIPATPFTITVSRSGYMTSASFGLAFTLEATCWAIL